MKRTPLDYTMTTQEFDQTNLINKMMFYLCLGASILVLLLACGLHFFHVEFLDVIHFPCIILRYTGFYCPACGMTRSVSAFLQGHLLKSFLYHPFVLCAMVLDLFTLGGRFIYLLMGKKERYFHFRLGYLYLLIAVVFVQWVIKLILQIL